MYTKSNNVAATNAHNNNTFGSVSISAQ